MADKADKKLFKFRLVYFKDTGKLYTEANVDWAVRYSRHDDSLPPTPYMPDAFAKVRGLRDTGGQGALPGLSGGWDGPILVDCDDGYPGLILPHRERK